MSRRMRPQSNTYRFFVPAETISGERVTIDDGDLVHQIGAVLRLGPGDTIVLLDDGGWEYLVEIEQIDRKRGVSGRVRERLAAPLAPPPPITVYLPLIRAERFEWALQKLTELGVAAIVPTHYAHSIVEPGPSEKKRDRWRKIVREAAEQSRRGRLPLLGATMAASEALSRTTPGLAYLLWEATGVQTLRRSLSTDCPARETPIALLSGPEGGLSDDELAGARGRGVRLVSLGPQTLRAETAPVAAMAMLQYALMDD